MIRVTLEGATWEEVEGEAMELIRRLNTAPKPGPTNYQPPAPPPATLAAATLPFDKGAALIPPPPEYVCQEHGARLNHKPAGTNRQGTPYQEGYRCPVAGCRTFVPMSGAAA